MIIFSQTIYKNYIVLICYLSVLLFINEKVFFKMKSLTISPKSSMLNGMTFIEPSTMNRQGRIQVKAMSRLLKKPILSRKNKIMNCSHCLYVRNNLKL